MLGILPQIITARLAVKLLFLRALRVDLKDTPEGS
jgi:hypothetical protein